MRSALAVAVAVLAASAAVAQSPAPSPRTGLGPMAAPTPPTEVAGWTAQLEVDALVPNLSSAAATAPEAQAVVGKLKAPTALVTRVFIAQDLTRHEIVSTDFLLPAGTIVLHRAGDKAYVIADPKTRTFAVMDAEPLLDAIEGGAGIEDSQYTATVVHTEEKRVISGQNCRKSIVTVNYVSAVPVENSKVLVQQKNDVEVWHTSGLASAAAMEHFFFKFQRDKTGTLRQTLAREIGFPMEVKMTVTAAGKGARASTAQPGSLHALVSDLKKEEKLEAALFRIPPAGYRRVDRLPYFGAAARPASGGK
jgi:hypothetical protein